MSAFWGYVWLVICIFLAIGMWCVNVVWVDNALPMVLDPITTYLPHPVVDYSSQANFWMVAMRWCPLFILLLGILGLILECTIWGTSDHNV